MKNRNIQKEIRRLFQAMPGKSLPEADKKKFIARLFEVKAGHTDDSLDRLPGMDLKIPVATLTSLLILIGSWYLLKPQYPIVSGVQGTVKIYRSARNEWVFADRAKMKLYKNDLLKTFKDGQADLLMPGVYHARIKNDSEFRLKHAANRISSRGIQYDLEKGKVFAYYEKAVNKKEFVINTEEAVVSVVGTEFMVKALPDINSTWVGVREGVVSVSSRHLKDITGVKDISVMVNPGEKTFVKTGQKPARPTRLMEDELMELEELYRIGTKPQVALLISTGRTRVRELLSLALLYVSADSKDILSDKIEMIESKFRKAVKSRTKEECLNNIEQFEDLINNHPDPKYDVQFLLFIGAYYEYLKIHGKAIEAFNRVVNEHPDSNLVSIAQCAIGLIYEEKLDDPEKAISAYKQVLDSYPKSPEADEAVAGLRRLASQ